MKFSRAIEFKFDVHVKEVVERIKIVYRSLLALTRSNKGYGCISLRTLYLGMTVPLTLYGRGELWGAAVGRRKTAIRAPKSVRRRILLKVCKAYRTVSAEACRVISGAVPTDLVIEERIKHLRRRCRWYG